MSAALFSALFLGLFILATDGLRASARHFLRSRRALLAWTGLFVGVVGVVFLPRFAVLVACWAVVLLSSAIPTGRRGEPHPVGVGVSGLASVAVLATLIEHSNAAAVALAAVPLFVVVLAPGQVGATALVALAAAIAGPMAGTPTAGWLVLVVCASAVALGSSQLSAEQQRRAAQEALARAALVDELEISQTARIRAEALATVGELAATVTHDVSTPLTSLLANLSILQRLPMDPMLHEAVEDSILAAEQVTAVVQDVRAVLAQDGDGEPLDPRRPLETAVRLARSQVSAHGELVVELARAPRVHARESRLVQVFLNLLMNAGQAIARDGGGSHTVTVRLGEDEDGDALIQVIDDGPGMPPAVLARVQEPLFTTRSDEGGTGLGLSSCKRLLSQCEGSLSIESTVGRGTTVSVRLPDCDKLIEEDTLPTGPHTRPKGLTRDRISGDTPPEGHASY